MKFVRPLGMPRKKTCAEGVEGLVQLAQQVTQSIDESLAVGLALRGLWVWPSGVSAMSARAEAAAFCSLSISSTRGGSALPGTR